VVTYMPRQAWEACFLTFRLSATAYAMNRRVNSIDNNFQRSFMVFVGVLQTFFSGRLHPSHPFVNPAP